MNKKDIKILVVDDEAINLHVVSDMLQNEYAISVATSGAKALEVIEKKPPDIILLDVHMPKMNGFELAKNILQNKKTKDTPLIFLSAEKQDSFIEQGFELGGVDYLTKPIDPKALKRKVALWARLVEQTKENKRNQNLLNEYKNSVDRSSIVSKANKHGHITYVNEKFCQISGYTKEELLGKPHSIVRHSDMPSAVFKEMWETIQAKKPWFGVVKNRTKNGAAYYVDTVVNPIVDENGEILEYIGVRHDITELEEYKELLQNELKHTSKSYQENKNYMTQYEIAINSVNGVIKTDTDNKIIYANSRFCELSGYNLDELLGVECSVLHDAIHKEKKDCQHIKEELAKKKNVIMLLANKAKDGRIIYMNTLFHPIVDIDGKVIKHLQIMHDITEIIELNREIVETQKEIVSTMGAIGETRSKETGLHVKRVAEYSYYLAKLAGLDEERAQKLKEASPMHDIGKVGIADSILNKPGKLTNDEYEIMKTHAGLGYEMLRCSKREILQTAATIAYTHHEKYAGNGYPNGISGENIPIEGRITAIADVFDALGHDRCYKKAWELEKILELFKEERGGHFDPKLIDLFFENLDDFLKIRDSLDENETLITKRGEECTTQN